MVWLHLEIKRLTFPWVFFPMEGSEVLSYFNEIVPALKTQNGVFWQSVLWKRSFCDSFGRLFWMRYENKVGFFFFLCPWNPLFHWNNCLKFQWQHPVAHDKLGVQIVSPHFNSVLKGNVVFSTLSQLLDLDYPSKREAAGQG